MSNAWWGHCSLAKPTALMPMNRPRGHSTGTTNEYVSLPGMHGCSAHDARCGRGRPQVTLRELEALFAARDFNAFPVVEHDRLIFLKAFIFTTTQMVPHYDELMSDQVAEVMTRKVVDVQPDAPLTRVLQIMVGLKARVSRSGIAAVGWPA